MISKPFTRVVWGKGPRDVRHYAYTWDGRRPRFYLDGRRVWWWSFMRCDLGRRLVLNQLHGSTNIWQHYAYFARALPQRVLQRHDRAGRKL